MGQAFLLRHLFQFHGIVAPATVADHDTAEMGGDEFPHFLVAMLRPDLIDRKPWVHKRHQKRRGASHPPARIVGMHHGWSCTNARSAFISSSDGDRYHRDRA